MEGSSPHPRGTLIAFVDADGNNGIIPASAGNTYRSVFICFYCKDHPRIRGEHENMDYRVEERAGSSPHPRGTPLTSSKLSKSPRIIPASAGNTRKKWLSSWENRDHPRIRGEHFPCTRFEAKIPGSSPHPRGTH